MNKKTHAQALADGDVKYYTGKPCVNEHLSTRYTRSRQCTQCHKERRKTDSVKKYNAEYRIKNRERILAQQKLSHYRNRDVTNPLRLAKYHATKHLPAEKAKKRAANARRRAVTRKASLPLTPAQQAQMEMYYEQAPIMSAALGIDYQVDHIQPLCRGGKHHPDNLQIITTTKNRDKFCTPPETRPIIRKTTQEQVCSINIIRHNNRDNKNG